MGRVAYAPAQPAEAAYVLIVREDISGHKGSRWGDRDRVVTLATHSLWIH